MIVREVGGARSAAVVARVTHLRCHGCAGRLLLTIEAGTEPTSLALRSDER
jgi:hypothetical protein